MKLNNSRLAKEVKMLVKFVSMKPKLNKISYSIPAYALDLAEQCISTA